ncbi:hypothetical protein J4468_04200 [Candidatus Woesearchaeota archaeon]|nr:hypothetical protein [Candidatus Woesearchaeota archaeon]
MTLLIGVEHHVANFGNVTNRLSYENIENKLVMLEIVSYPLPEYEIENFPECAKFWDKLCQYILEKNGKLLYGENEKFYYNAHRRRRKLNREQTSIIKEIHDLYEKLECIDNYYYPAEKYKLQKEIERLKQKDKEGDYEYNWIAPFIERDPHFAEMVNTHKPDIAILGLEHIPHIIENCFPKGNCSVIYIPTEDMIKRLTNSERLQHKNHNYKG